MADRTSVQRCDLSAGEIVHGKKFRERPGASPRRHVHMFYVHMSPHAQLRRSIRKNAFFGEDLKFLKFLGFVKVLWLG
jgi:hypothetical protein